MASKHQGTVDELYDKYARTLEMLNKAIAEMSADGTTANITKKWFGRDISM